MTIILEAPPYTVKCCDIRRLWAMRLLGFRGGEDPYNDLTGYDTL